jgi:hypothetical protein
MSVESAVPRPLRWSEVPISFSRDDQWTSFSEPSKFPLVLDPVVAELKLTRVLIDGGSGLSDPGLRDCVHNVFYTGLGDRTCPIPYLCCTLLACEVGLTGTEGNYSSCT